MLYKYVLILSLLVANAGCVTDVNLSLEKDEPRVVIEGLVTDELYDKSFQSSHLRERDGNYVRLTYSDPVNKFDNFSFKQDEAKPIRNARVLISDDLGRVDTLSADSAQHEAFSGYYVPERMIFEAGRTYYLTVRVGERVYTAKAYMPPAPTIDSVVSVFLDRPIEKFSGYVPLLYFRRLMSEEEFYIAKVVSVPRFTDAEVPPFAHFNAGIGGRIWNYDVVDARRLPKQVSGLTVRLGVTSSTYFTTSLYYGDTYDACLFSLTKQAYEYYSSLISQLENDGGAYSPAPGSPRGNIQGGALGFFNASSASVKRFKVE